VFSENGVGKTQRNLSYLRKKANSGEGRLVTDLKKGGLYVGCMLTGGGRTGTRNSGMGKTQRMSRKALVSEPYRDRDKYSSKEQIKEKAKLHL